MKKASKFLKMLIGSAALFCASTAFGQINVSMSFNISELRDNADNKIAANGALVVIAASTTDETFGSPEVADSIGTVGTLGLFGQGDDMIINSFLVDAQFGDGTVNNNLNFDTPSGIAGGEAFGIFWFPGKTALTDNLTFADSYGFFRDDNMGTETGTAWTVPSAGGSVSYSLFTAGNGFGLTYSGGSLSGSTHDVGTHLEAGTKAGVTVLIPEPSSALLAMFGLLGLAFRRRRW